MKPYAMGGLMGAMMLWMLHGALTGDGIGGWALVGFIGAHVVLVALVLGAAVFASRLSPKARGFIDRLHRPSLRHVTMMFGSAVAVGGVVHLAARGLGGV